MKRKAQSKLRRPLLITILVLSTILFLALFPQRFPEETLRLEAGFRAFLDEVTLPLKLSRLALQTPDTELLMPVYGNKAGSVSDTWRAARDGVREHEGQDIFAKEGTPVFSATDGYVRRISTTAIGGNNVLITGAGGRRYYYAHLTGFAEGLHVGQYVTKDVVLGFVGNTGNAITTPPHLHFGMYEGRNALNPLPLIVDRW